MVLSQCSISRISHAQALSSYPANGKNNNLQRDPEDSILVFKDPFLPYNIIRSTDLSEWAF